MLNSQNLPCISYQWEVSKIKPSHKTHLQNRKDLRFSLFILETFDDYASLCEAKIYDFGYLVIDTIRCTAPNSVTWYSGVKTI